MSSALWALAAACVPLVACGGCEDAPEASGATWEECSIDSELTFEAFDPSGGVVIGDPQDFEPDPYADLPYSYTFAGSIGTIAPWFSLALIASESDDLEDVGDHNGIFLLSTITFDEGQTSGTAEWSNVYGISQTLFDFSLLEMDGVPGVEKPVLGVKSLVVNWETEGGEPPGIGARVVGDYELVLAPKCFVYDFELGYRGTFETTIKPQEEENPDPCSFAEISGDFDKEFNAGDLEIFADGRLLEFDLERASISPSGDLSVLAFEDNEDDDPGNSVLINVPDLSFGENSAGLASFEIGECSYVPLGGVYDVASNESGDVTLGPTEINFSGTGMLGGDSPNSCADSVELEGTMRVGFCRGN